MLHRMLVQLGFAEDFQNIGPIKNQKSDVKISKLLRCKSTEKTRNEKQQLPELATIDNLLSSYLKSQSELDQIDS